MNKVSIYSLNFCLDKLKITMQILTNLCLYTHSNPIVYVSHNAKCDIQYTIVIIEHDDWGFELLLCFVITYHLGLRKLIHFLHKVGELC